MGTPARLSRMPIWHALTYFVEVGLAWFITNSTRQHVAGFG
ncbi:hypothetical protein [Marinobacter nanhaiticus]|nr:hypothetical protein [Marinobacter nanhaiticus]